MLYIERRLVADLYGRASGGPTERQDDTYRAYLSRVSVLLDLRWKGLIVARSLLSRIQSNFGFLAAMEQRSGDPNSASIRSDLLGAGS